MFLRDSQGVEKLALPVVEISAAIIEMSTPLLIAALGEIFVERSGVLNLGIEGMMLVGAFSGFAGAYFSGNFLFGFLIGLVVGMSIGALMAYLSVKLGVDQILAGLAIWIFSIGLSTFLARTILGIAPGTVTIKGLEPINIPLLSQLPILGPILFQHNILVYLVLISVPLFHILLFRTTFGLKVRAVGENPKAADTLGIHVHRIRFLCLLLGGAMAGLAGSYLTVARYHVWIEEVTAGMGWIALVVVFFGKRSPYRALLGAWIIATGFSLRYYLQIAAFWIPYQFILMLPYILTIILLVGIVGKEETPAAFCIPYKREET